MDSTPMERRKMVTIPQEEFEAMLELAAERGARHALAEAQDTIERGDVHPKQRALAMRRLTGGAAIVASRKAAPPQTKGRGKKP